MPPRSFQHWYRGASIEAVSRTSTSMPWGGRGTLTAPVLRVGAAHIVSANANLWAGGFGRCTTNTLANATCQAALGGSTPFSVMVDQAAVAGISFTGASGTIATQRLTPSGGLETGGDGTAFTSTTAVSEGGGHAGGSSEQQASLWPHLGGGGSTSGMATATVVGTEMISGGMAIGRTSTIALVHGLISSGGTSIGGNGEHTMRPPGRSFKHWFRGGAVGDFVLTRSGDFARVYRGHLGLPSTGAPGSQQVSAATAGGATAGGSAAGSIHIDGRIDGAAALRVGGTSAPQAQHPLITSGGVETAGEVWAPTIGASFDALARGALGGVAWSQWMTRERATAILGTGGSASSLHLANIDSTATVSMCGVYSAVIDQTGPACGGATVGGAASLGFDDRLVIAWSPGGGGDPRVEIAHAANASLTTVPTAVFHVETAVRSISTVGFGAYAQTGIIHEQVGINSLGVTVGGSPDTQTTYNVVANGGLGIGGTHRHAEPGIVYRIYVNDGQGGPIDYGSPIAETSGLEWTSGVLPSESSLKFGVRAYEADRGIQEENLDAYILLRIDMNGHDTSLVPLPPIGLRVIELGGGRARIEWDAVGSAASRAPTKFHIYLAPEPILDLSSPRIVVPASIARGQGHTAEIQGLVDGRYGVIVRAVNAHGEENNTRAVVFNSDGTPPSQIEDLTASTSASVA